MTVVIEGEAFEQRAATELLDETGGIDDGVEALPDDIPGIDDDEPVVEAEKSESDEDEKETGQDDNRPDDEKSDGEDEEEYFEFEPDEEGGEPLRVPASQVVEGYNKSKELEAEVEQLQSQVSAMPAEVENVVQNNIRLGQEYLHGLQAVQQMFVPVEPNAELANPASPQFNPELYTAQREQFMADQRQYAERAAEIERVQQQTDHMQQVRERARHAQGREQLLRQWPELKDEKVASEFQQDLERHFQIDAKTLSTVLDPRLYMLARHAIANVKATAAQKQAAKVVKAKPKFVRGKARGNPKQQVRASARDRLSKTGSLDDALDAIDDEILGL